MASSLEIARERLAERRAELEKIPVELQVKDAAHARSAEVIEFCVRHLSGGGTWAELRRKLGLANSGVDHRWRIIRGLVAEGLIPSTEEDALKAQISMRAYLLDKLEEFTEEVEARIETIGHDKYDKATEAQLYKIRLDSMKLLLEENNSAFQSFVEMQRLKKMEKSKQGPSIVVQNKFYIPRPGDDLAKLREVTETAVELIETKALLEGETDESVE